jgi:hypothetical protein
MTLHDEFLPEYHFSEIHAIRINASRDKIAESIQTLNFHDSRIIRILYSLRGLPKKAVTGLEGAKEMGFTVLRECEQQEILLGIIGQFWTPAGKIQRFKAEEFKTFNDSAFARATWNFKIIGDHAPFVVETETRIACPDARTRKKFSRYWFFIRPFSGLIRLEMLKIIRKKSIVS